jgi:hypothetical protein
VIRKAHHIYLGETKIFRVFLFVMNNSEKEGSTSVQDPLTVSEPQNATAFERWRKKAWRAAGFGLSDDEYQESMTRSCEKQRDYLMNYSAYHVP